MLVPTATTTSYCEPPDATDANPRAAAAKVAAPTVGAIGFNGCAASWKELFAAGNGWDPPRLSHQLLRPEGDYISALQPLRLPPAPQAAGSDGRHRPGGGGTAAGGGGLGGELLLALADSEDLLVWQMPLTPPAPAPAPAAASAAAAAGSRGSRGGCSCDGGSGGGGLTAPAPAPVSASCWSARRVASCPLERSELVYSLAWAAGPGVRAGSPANASSSSSSSAAPSAASAATSSGSVILAAGTNSGMVKWYEYGTDAAGGGGSGGGGGGGGGAGGGAGRLRLLGSTGCGSSAPLVDLHVLRAADCNLDGSGSGGGGGGALLVALQDATFSMAIGAGVRNAVQLYDVGTQRHLASVVDPFESYEFVCCCGAAGSGRSGGGGTGSAGAVVDPHVLLVGSVHGGFCAQCFQSGLPSLCHHKQLAATAALSTLDVRCPRGGLTQRFALPHRSLYPRLAAARQHYVFTSHASTALEVYDRRAMSAPLYTLHRLPRPPPPEEEVVVVKEAGGGEGAEGDFGWQAGPAAVPSEHQGLWLEASDDVLLGREENA
ncbi:hypothetical protein GPECTOR_1g401 [Gonium pectorale]|uniref:Uncharacterized protein n=1 Tax=Gonium pectorale TaxID=33097 RepID=A0A150H2Q6_GONPE|nr:hypothetical protein GPECTOR_1g401 [Gonium pectorale]|eukprot:KXZ56449.1 hypothetical protein GPECTOR_1g401 [Gonium pectorale]